MRKVSWNYPRLAIAANHAFPECRLEVQKRLTQGNLLWTELVGYHAANLGPHKFRDLSKIMVYDRAICLNNLGNSDLGTFLSEISFFPTRVLLDNVPIQDKC